MRPNRFIQRFLATTISLWLIVVQSFAVTHPPAATGGLENSGHQVAKRECSCSKVGLSAKSCARASCCAVNSSGTRPVNQPTPASLPTSGAGNDLVQPPAQLALAAFAAPSRTPISNPFSSATSPTVPLFARHCTWLI